MRLHIVGTGCPDARADAFGSAFALELEDECLLVDCGPATTYKLARMGIVPGRIDHVFLTHHHFDHNVDLPCFLLSRWDQSKGTEPALRVLGPEPTSAFVKRLLGEGGAFETDWRSRVTHAASHWCHRARGGVFPRPAPAVEAHDIDTGFCLEVGRWSVRAARVKHVEPTMVSLAYRFDTPAGSIVFAGDCADCEALRELSHDADNLVVACTHFGPPMSPAITEVIAGTPDVAAIARAAGVKRLILSHTSPNFAQPGEKEKAVAAVARDCDAEIVFPAELATVDL